MEDTKDTKPVIHKMLVTINLPCTRFPDGRNSDCAFIHVGDVVSLCHPVSGVPVQDPNGKEYKFTLPAGSTFVDARIHAARLCKDFRLALYGKTPSNERFSRAIVYPRDGGVI